MSGELGVDVEECIIVRDPVETLRKRHWNVQVLLFVRHTARRTS